MSAVRNKPMKVFWLVLMAVALMLPLMFSNAFVTDVAIRIAINATIAIALNLLIGYTGQISIGHAGFFAMGAYSSAILTTNYGWSSTAALASGLLLVSGVAFFMAQPLLKLKGHYLGMATLGFGIIVSIIITNESAVTGGPDGISVATFDLLGFAIDSERKWYVVCALLMLGMAGAARRIIMGPAGRALQAIDGSEIAAQVAGINVPKMKVSIFVFSAAVASLMGSVSAHYIGFVTPGASGFFHSIELMTMVVVGGMASIPGSIVGAALITLLPQLLSSFEGWETMIFGAILASSVVFMPKGIVPTLVERFKKVTQ